jgi:hypothetical protein
MSTSLAAAKKRRAPQQNTPPPPPMDSRNVAQPQGPPSGLTLPQVIAVVDKRLLALEINVKQLLETPDEQTAPMSSEIPSNITEVLDEFNSRFETMAVEIENLKNIVLSLQSYTMDVNKMLLEERVRILSDNGPSSSSSQLLESSAL